MVECSDKTLTLKVRNLEDIMSEHATTEEDRPMEENVVTSPFN